MDHWRRGRPAQSVRQRRAVLQAFASLGPEARDPFAHGAFTDPEGRGHGLRGLPLVDNAAYDLGSTTRRKFCILMDVHPGLPSRFVDRFRHPSASEIQPRMDNLLRDHTWSGPREDGLVVIAVRRGDEAASARRLHGMIAHQASDLLLVDHPASRIGGGTQHSKMSCQDRTRNLPRTGPSSV